MISCDLPVLRAVLLPLPPAGEASVAALVDEETESEELNDLTWPVTCHTSMGTLKGRGGSLDHTGLVAKEVMVQCERLVWTGMAE